MCMLCCTDEKVVSIVAQANIRKGDIKGSGDLRLLYQYFCDTLKYIHIYIYDTGVQIFGQFKCQTSFIKN